MGHYVVGISGASGVILGHRMVVALLELGHQVECVITANAHQTAEYELKEGLLSGLKSEKLQIHAMRDMGSCIASGSFHLDGMVIIPCSMTTLAAVALGLADNLLRRAADVCLKEKRPLIIVPRESPFSEIHLENMLKLAQRGATIVAAIPAWYTQPQTIEDMELFIVGKALDALKITHSLYPHWKG